MASSLLPQAKLTRQKPKSDANKRVYSFCHTDEFVKGVMTFSLTQTCIATPGFHGFVQPHPISFFYASSEDAAATAAVGAISKYAAAAIAKTKEGRRVSLTLLIFPSSTLSCYPLLLREEYVDIHHSPRGRSPAGFVYVVSDFNTSVMFTRSHVVHLRLGRLPYR
jgi:hypothetical protein